MALTELKIEFVRASKFRETIRPLPDHVRRREIADLLETDRQNVRHRLDVIVVNETSRREEENSSICVAFSALTDRRNGVVFAAFTDVFRPVEDPGVENRRILIFQGRILVAVDVPRAKGNAEFLSSNEIRTLKKQFRENRSVG